MFFKLNNNVVSENTDNLIRLINTDNGAIIEIKELLAKEIRDILNGADSLDAVTNFARLQNISYKEAQFQLNGLLYVLLKDDYITTESTDYLLKSCVVEIIDRCNFNCEHCYKAGKKEQMLSLSQIKELSKDLITYNCGKITLTGGEVLLHPNFKEIYLIYIMRDLWSA